MKILFEVNLLKSIVRSSRVIIFIVAIIALSACTKTEDYLRDIIIKHSNFVDPGSVMFRNVTSRSDLWDIWCGEINAKNRMGGYVGWKPFSVTVHKDGEVFVTVLQPEEPEYGASTAMKNAIENFNKVHEDIYKSECRDTQPSSSWVPFWK